MGSMICMNELCRATTSSEWKKGWSLKSGGFAKLCYNCGSAFENLVFCETFHSEESGWRECKTCRKLIHCGCIASKYLYEYMDYGGVACINCASQLDGHSIRPIQIPGDDLPNGTLGTKATQSLGVENKMDENSFDKRRVMRLSKPVETSESGQLFQTQKNDIKQETMLPIGNVSTCFSNLNQQPVGAASLFGKPDNDRQCQGVKDMYESINQPSLNFSLSTLVGASSSAQPFPGGDVEGREQSKSSPFQLGQRTRHILPKPPKPSPNSGSESNKAMASQTRVARPPAEGRGGRNQLLPRYWPRITDQELQQISGEYPCQKVTIMIFSRIDPGGKLVMGFRKATNNADMQDPQPSILPNGSGFAETSFTGMTENLPNGGRTSDDSVNRQVPISEKKKAKNIGSKNKRLLMHADDVMELRITWEEAQELLRPPPTSKPTVVVIEDYEFEEYEEPPVFGKRTIFTARSSGDQEQWAQCDSCSKWRRLPVHVLLPAKWTCSDNIWDSRRCSCAAPDEINPRELEALFRVGKDLKRRKLVENNEDCEPSGLDALATLAVLGDNIGDLGEPSVGATTKHPRHRPGCSCIVCIQPPSGKGKHQPTCKCNVCLTVKRRFKTLMLRKKKKQSEREAELAQAKDQVPPKDGSETDGGSGTDLLLHMNQSENEHMNLSENERDTNGDQTEEFGAGKGQLDLNSHPNRDDDMLVEPTAGMTMTSLVNATDLPLEYLTQNGLESLGDSLLSQAAAESERNHPDNGFTKTADAEQENKGDEG
ncbi:b3 domain-containing transcription repressor val1 [Nicotiana attenuata]|uniref:B3 domain-containing transcription repressor val1 n=1 Tax=Nicotiana attenuata TaxID=49451 RepID=A0A1J6ICW2_NICAT|nr:b3 domain-containing transcription repressor val1 [Nicotiana attenuata]